MDLKSYTTEDFLTNESFRNYCLGNDGSDRIFWENWITRHPNKKREVDKAVALFFTLSGDWRPKQLERSFRSFQSRIQRKISDGKITPGEGRQPSNKVIQYTVSAIIMTLFYLTASQKICKGIEVFVNNASYRTTYLEKYIMMLPNETKVVLNSASSLRWPSTFIRLVSENIEGRGAAYFEIIEFKTFC